MNAKLMIVAALLSGCATVSPMQQAIERESAAVDVTKAEVKKCGDDALCMATVEHRFFVPAAVCKDCAIRYVGELLRVRTEEKDRQKRDYQIAEARNQYQMEVRAYIDRQQAADYSRRLMVTSMIVGNMQRTQANATALGVANTIANSPYYRPNYILTPSGPVYPLGPVPYGW